MTRGRKRGTVPTMERGPVLVCIEGAQLGRIFGVTPEGLRIGRDPANEIVVEDTGVSRQHARVLLHNGAVWVQDAGSRNGVFVNEQRVPDHRQVKLGDKLKVGATLFELRAAPPTAAAAPVGAPPVGPHVAPPSDRPVAPTAQAPGGGGGWKIWPVVVAAVVVAALIAAVTLLGGKGGGASERPTTSPAYSLSSALAEPTAGPGGSAAAPSGGAAPSVQEALAIAAGADAASQAARLPDAPAGATPASLMEKAQGMMDAGRLNDARIHYQMALKLDPGCALCKLRIEKLGTDIQRRAQEQLDAGMRAYGTLQYAQASTAFETVLLLVPDPADPLHARAQEGLSKAKAGGKP